MAVWLVANRDRPPEAGRAIVSQPGRGMSGMRTSQASLR